MSSWWFKADRSATHKLDEKKSKALQDTWEYCTVLGTKHYALCLSTLSFKSGDITPDSICLEYLVCRLRSKSVNPSVASKSCIMTSCEHTLL